MPPVDTPDAILRFLESVGKRSETDFYLNLFRAEEKESFANLVATPAALRGAFEAVVLDLKFLHGLGLVPVVSIGFYGGGAASIEHADKLRRKLEKRDVRSVVYRADSANLAALITSSARDSRIPIVALAGPDFDDVAASFDALGALSANLRTKKLIFLSRRGGLRPRRAERWLPIVNLATDYDSLIAQKCFTPKEMVLLEQSRRLLVERVSHRMLIAVTSPLQLLRELFTTKGAGTLIRRGSSIARKTSFADVDIPRFSALLRSSFGREVSTDFFERDVASIYVEDGYRGAAVVRALPQGAYLCKLAVEREAQGEGIGRDLWQLLAIDYPAFFWRARPDNPIVPFYVQECDGMARADRWTVFWKGLSAEKIPEAIATALAKPADFAAEAPAG
jgi:acetylglutamate kinase